MLEQMVEIQNSVSELLDIPREMDSLQEAAIGLGMEVVSLGDSVEDARLEPKVLETLNLNKADCSAVAALAYLLEYFVLRDWDAYDIEAAYLMLMGEIVKKQEQEKEVEEASDEAFFDVLKNVLAGDLPEFVKAFNTMEAQMIEEMNGMNDLELKQSYMEMQIEETAKVEIQDYEALEARLEMEKERLNKVMQEAIGPDFGPGPGM